MFQISSSEELLLWLNLTSRKLNLTDTRHSSFSLRMVKIPKFLGKNQ